jgi:hypothetical protein
MGPDLDLEEPHPSAPHPLGDVELPPEKGVDCVFNCYNALVTGIIMFALASVATF